MKESMKKFLNAALLRAVRTVSQTAIATIGSAAILSEVNWAVVVSASVLAGILSILTSIATGLPEAPKEASNDNDSERDLHESNEHLS